MPSLLDRLIGLADEPTDDDDLRLRKRVGVIAGYILVVGPLQLPLLAQGLPLSWFVAATMPLVSASNAAAAVSLAKSMLSALAEVRARHGVALELRIGIASGPVVGGVIGQRRILFDLWGDTVNTASRMQSSGIAGRIHVAASTYQLLRGSWQFEEREPVDVKGLGPMTTYLLADRRDIVDSIARLSG